MDILADKMNNSCKGNAGIWEQRSQILAPSAKNNRDNVESKRAESSTNKAFHNMSWVEYECIHIFRS